MADQDGHPGRPHDRGDPRGRNYADAWRAQFQERTSAVAFVVAILTITAFAYFFFGSNPTQETRTSGAQPNAGSDASRVLNPNEPTKQP